MMSEINLTRFSKGSGCGCKIAPAVLEELLRTENKFVDRNLLVGNESKDDAAVYRTGSGDCIISTTDFFTPIVDDAFDFGRIAAANAISDVFAMGGRPLMAIAILGWPVEKIPIEIAASVLEGGRSVCKEAGIALAGGHSVDLPEPVFGLAVTGIVSEKNIKRNNTAKESDLLYLTKPLGSGIYSAISKKGLLKPEHREAFVANLAKLNKIGAVLGEKDYVHAMTDVTGFGLLGHLLEMTDGTELTARVQKSSLPKLSGFDEYASQFIYPGNTTRNFSAFAGKADGMSDLDFLLMCDPQTNGGLMIAVDERNRDDFEKLMKEQQTDFWLIGNFQKRAEKNVLFV